MNALLAENIKRLADEVGGTGPTESLRELTRRYPGEVVFSTSFGIEDQVITHLILTHSLPIRIFTLDTGRLFPETYALWALTNERYKTRIESFAPEALQIQSFVNENGPNAFYESVDLRKQCCHLRKVEPLKRALQGNAVWVTGIRSGQSDSRSVLGSFEWDPGHKLVKYHPLFLWSAEEVQAFARQHNVPCNPLHDQGFASIGCAPCTRAIRPGEHARSGRWWWENPTNKECGLHQR